jgi:hypothetical protein
MFKIIGQTLSLPTKVVRNASSRQVMDYSSWANADLGVEAEDQIYRILSFLDAEVYLGVAGSALDCELKADIVVEVGDMSFVWQIKSSETGANNHFSKRAILTQPDGSKREYPSCACITASNKITEGLKPYQLLEEIANMCGVGLSVEAEQAIALSHKMQAMKGQAFPSKMFRQQFAALLALGLVKVDKGFITFI